MYSASAQLCLSVLTLRCEEGGVLWSLTYAGMEVDSCCCSPSRSHFFALTYPFIPLCAPLILACSLPLSPPPPPLLTRQVSAVGWEDSIHLVLDSDELLRNPFLGMFSEGGWGCSASPCFPR